MKTFELDFQETFDDIVLLNRRDFNGDFYLSFFSFSYFEPNFLKVLVSLIASDGEDILIQIVEFWITAFGDDS